MAIDDGYGHHLLVWLLQHLQISCLAFYLLPLLYILRDVARIIFQKERTHLKNVWGLSSRKEHIWFQVTFTVVLSSAWMISLASSPSASLPHISYIPLSPDYLPPFSLSSCPVKSYLSLSFKSSPNAASFVTLFLILLKFTVAFFNSRSFSLFLHVVDRMPVS